MSVLAPRVYAMQRGTRGVPGHGWYVICHIIGRIYREDQEGTVGRELKRGRVRAAREVWDVLGRSQFSSHET